MKCFGAQDQVSRVLFADGTAPPMAAIAPRHSLEQRGFAQPGARHRFPAPILISSTHPDFQGLLPLLEVTPDPQPLRMWGGAHFRGAELIWGGYSWSWAVPGDTGHSLSVLDLVAQRGVGIPGNSSSCTGEAWLLTTL